MYSQSQRAPGLLCTREKIDWLRFQYLARVKSCLGECYIQNALGSGKCEPLSILPDLPLSGAIALRSVAMPIAPSGAGMQRDRACIYPNLS